MSTRFVSIENLHAAIEEDIKHIESNVHGALERTAIDAVLPIRRRVPVAFGELRDSVHPVLGTDIATAVTAPHAAAVEIGSQPHTPNFADLLAWVKLRGMQGLTDKGRIKTRGYKPEQGPTTPAQAARVANMLRDQVTRKGGGGFGTGRGRYSPINAPEVVARAISKGIEEHGTRPHWFVRESLGDIGKILRRELRKKQ